MSEPWKILVADLHTSEEDARAIGDRLRDAWDDRSPIACVGVTADELLEGDLRGVDAVVLLARGEVEQRSIYPLLSAIEEAGVATMALRDRAVAKGDAIEFAGIPSLPLDAADQSLCCLLRGMLARQNELRHLRSEISLARRFHGGLEGEVARMHEELQLAAMVQREFLPREIPCLHNVDVAALWRPANYVSGDIYDVMRLDEDHIGLFLADAVGHGVPAALMTMVICRSLITKETSGSTYRLVSPGEVLSQLNREMIRRQGQTTRFATATYALFNCRTRTGTVASAGHPPPIVLHPGRPSRQIEAEGGLLGVFADERYENAEFELAADDRLLLYSDGFEQAFPAAEADSYARRLPSTRYREEFDRLDRFSSAAEMVDAVVGRVDDQSGSLHQVDDLTLLCAHTAPLRVGRTPVSDGAVQRVA